ncbi:MAG: SdpI family protein [Sarcina sp.]
MEVLEMNLPLVFVFLIAGFFMKFKPPKNINGFIGYRTVRSKKNKDSWNYANRRCGEIMLQLGLLSTVLILTSTLFAMDMNSGLQNIIGLVEMILILIVVVIIPIYLVEKELKEKFED